MYPISRTNLQNYPDFLRHKEEEKKRGEMLNQTVDSISQFIILVASRNNKGMTLPTTHILFKSHDYKQIKEKLTDRFPDTDFMFDSLHTNLSIDWS